MERVISAIKGINAIPVTPFDESGGVDYAALERQLAYLAEGGIRAIYPCGNTGEYFSLTLEEARRIVELSVDRLRGKAAVIAGVGYDARTAADLARHAEQAGADGIMLHQPVNPFQHEAGMLAYYREVAASTRLPVILYVKHPDVSAETLREAADIPNVIGVKYAVNHLPSFAKAVQLIGDKLAWICGTAEMWAPFFYCAGAVGFTSGMVNVDVKRSRTMLEALEARRYEDAFRVWEALRPFEEMRERRGNRDNVSVVKEALAQLGRCGGTVRPPIAPLGDEDKRRVSAILKGWGLLG